MKYHSDINLVVHYWYIKEIPLPLWEPDVIHAALLSHSLKRQLERLMIILPCFTFTEQKCPKETPDVLSWKIYYFFFPDDSW